MTEDDPFCIGPNSYIDVSTHHTDQAIVIILITLIGQILLYVIVKFYTFILVIAHKNCKHNS